MEHFSCTKSEILQNLMSMDRSSKIGNDNEQQDNKNNVVIFSRINILQKKPKQSIA